VLPATTSGLLNFTSCYCPTGLFTEGHGRWSLRLKAITNDKHRHKRLKDVLAHKQFVGCTAQGFALLKTEWRAVQCICTIFPMTVHGCPVRTAVLPVLVIRTRKNPVTLGFDERSTLKKHREDLARVGFDEGST
jgi:hypothetical protein